MKRSHSKKQPSKREANNEGDNKTYKEVSASQHIRRRFEVHERACEVIGLVSTAAIAMTWFFNHRAGFVWAVITTVTAALFAFGFWFSDHERNRLAHTPPSNDLDKRPAPSLETPPPTPMKDNRPNIKISSTKQSGGFTGYNTGTVNLVPPDRSIDTQRAHTILGSGTTGTAKLAFAANSDEAGKLALSLADALSEHGWKVEDTINPTITAPPMPTGISFFVNGAYFQEPIPIENLSEPGKTLYKLLSEAIVGNTTVAVQGSDMVPVGKVVINVGPKF